MFEFLSLLLNVCFDALYWIILNGIAYEEKRKIYILLNQHQIKIQTNSWKWKWNTENVKSFLKLKMKDFFTYDKTTGHVFKSNNLISVYNLQVLSFKVKLLSTDKYLFNDWDLLKDSKNVLEVALREVAPPRLKLILKKSHLTRIIKHIIHELIFE